eukprot:scaffold7692_cov430-Prasinococcus_capsulatus_cf.AAC.1
MSKAMPRAACALLGLSLACLCQLSTEAARVTKADVLHSILPQDTEPSLRAPAYFEPQGAITILYAYFDFVRPELLGGRSPVDVQASMAAALQPHVHVRVGVATNDGGGTFAERVQRFTQLMGVPVTNVTFYPMSYCDIWARDTGPIWVREEASQQCTMVLPSFSLWGYEYEHVKRAASWRNCDAPPTMAFYLSMYTGMPFEDARDWVTEGGDKSFDSQRAMVMDAYVERQRNPDSSLQQIEQLAKRYLGVTKVYWTGLDGDTQETFEGFPLDDLQSWNTISMQNKTVFTSIGTGGHVDEYCRIVGRTAEGKLHLLLAQGDKSGPTNYERLEKTYEHLQKLYGDELVVTRMPMPPDVILEVDARDEVYDNLGSLKGLTLTESIYVMPAKSYMNYIVANDAILFPEYGEDTDALALATIQQAFPTRKVYTINPLPLNYGGGGMNCISNNQPVCANEQPTFYAPLTQGV